MKNEVQITIATTAGPRTIPAERVAKTPFVIFDIRKNGMRAGIQHSLRYSVTHEHTGYAAAHAKTKASAHRAAKQLAALDIDWAQSPDELKQAAAGCRERIIEIRTQAMKP